ncbi:MULTISPECIES: malonate--CoA ligase [unclassified Sulfitobacter]|uniref:malonate--CoA ligase n=1 Tax=unclassified Sulfitobacter TaxID=196795 RepID=UPI0007C2DD93|nr:MULTISPECIES: malonyl-CoA synthase [unclassified Sulfitobacter]KZY03682.1 malonyl-CoA synthase [Sulfitobacter sp. HI0023]KZY24171.1 malonyl-CoA synthase [Sulfitobacter sp. HI0040]
MYDGNHLARTLRAASSGRESATFSTDPATGQTTSSGALWERAERVASALVSLGVEPGDRVAVQAEKSLGVLELYLGTILAGAIHLPLNTAYTAAEIGYFLSDASPRLFVCDPSRQNEFADVISGAEIKSVLTLDADGNGSLTEKVESAAPFQEPAPRGADDLAAILYTSGTTGRSKGAMLTHGNLASNAETLRDLWQFTKEDVLIHALPLFHTHGLFVAINITLVAGGAILLHRAFDPDAILADFNRATSLMGVPTFYTRLLAHPDLTQDSIASMRLFVSGSAPMLADTHREWQARTGQTVLERYGMTETCMNTSNPYEGVRKPGTVGLPLKGVELRITTAKGKVLPRGEIGGIEVRGPNLFKGYWNMPKKTAEEMRPDGWFITGDLGHIDDDGYVTIVGRSKDLIISGGYNIYPKEIEATIDQIEGIVESAAFGVPHADFGESVAVAIVREAGGTISADDIMAKISGELARFKLPRKIFFVDALPRNTMGKVQKNLLRSGKI